MDALAALLEEVNHYCDLADRLEHVPADGRVRGLYFRSIEAALKRAGRAGEYRALFPEHYAAVLWYPAADFLLRLVVGSALLRGPAQVHDGMFDIGRGNAVAFAESLIGRVLLRLLSNDPKKLLEQGLLGRRQGQTCGVWRLSFPTERSAIMSMVDEPMYIESYLRGACLGTFEAISVSVRVEVQLDDRFSGRHLMTW